MQDPVRIWGVICVGLVLVLVARVLSQRWVARSRAEILMDTSAAAPGRAGGDARCEACGYDLRGTPAQCPECGAPVPPHRRPLDPKKLHGDWPLSPIEPRVPAPHEAMTLVWDAPHWAAAELLANQLLARGIKAVPRDRTHAVQIGAYATTETWYAVYVWSDDVEAAHAIMERFAPAMTDEA